MATLGAVLLVVGGIVSLVCFILVLIKMFQRGKTGLGIASIVLFFCCGIGQFVPFVYGWMKSGEWNLRNVMLAWTAGFVLEFAGAAMNPAVFQQVQQIPQQQQPVR